MVATAPDPEIACDVLVLGGAGLAGRAVVAEARRRGLETLAASRGAEVAVDVRDAAALLETLRRLRPGLIVNAAAIVSVPACEADPAAAWMVNTRPAALLADHAHESGARLVHISTDHFYAGDGARPHREDEPVTLMNEYALSKSAAETLALTAPTALVLRTNILGLRSATGTSLGEWALDVIAHDRPATLFTDQYVSTLDVWSFAEGLMDLAASGATGLLNLASREVFSKAALVQAMAAALGRTLTRAQPGTVTAQAVARPDSLGLDVARAETILGRRLPSLGEVAARLARHVPARLEA